MLRRLAVLLLLLLPAPLTAQFTPFTAPGGNLWHRMLGGSYGAGLDVYLLDASGARVGALDNDPGGWFRLGTFAAGESFGFEFFDSGSGAGDATPDIVRGSLADVPRGVTLSFGPLGDPSGSERLLNVTANTGPELMSIALLATGLVGMGAVGWRRKRWQEAVEDPPRRAAPSPYSGPEVVMRVLLALALTVALSAPASAQVYRDRGLFEAAVGGGLRHLSNSRFVEPPDGFHIDYTDPISGISIHGIGCYAAFGWGFISNTLPCPEDGDRDRYDWDRALTITIPRGITAVGFDVFAISGYVSAFMPDGEYLWTPADWWALDDPSAMPSVFRGYTNLRGATIELDAPGGGYTDFTAGLDGFVYAATPEPGEIALLATGLIGLCAVRVRRRKADAS